jgi:hypothetical protein
VHGGSEFAAISQIYFPTNLSEDSSKVRVLFDVGCLQFLFFEFENPQMIERMQLQEITCFPFQ